MPVATRLRKKKALRRMPRVTLRDVIRNTARELFAKEGYQSVSMRRIAAEIGCSPMAMYRHFADKDDLLLSICEETFDQMNRLLDKEHQKFLPPLETLRASVSTIMDFHVSHPNHFRVTYLTSLPSGPLRERKAVMARGTVDRLRNGIRECAEAKGIGIDVETMTQMIRVAIHGFASIMINTHPVCPLGNPQQLKQQLVRTLTRELE
ncbi:MAG TPA: TetR/AcrR family transcriptional regulator [Candidatus Angelobacter sp.]